MRQAYTSTVVGPVPLGLGIVCAGATGIIAATARAPAWLTAALVIVILLAAATRLTVRPGPTLHLQLRTGEHIRISTADPEAARTLLTATEQEAP